MNQREIEMRTGHDFSVEADSPALPFFSISLTKLAVLSICSIGIYEFYWFFKNWQRIRDRNLEEKKISPFWRAFFAPFYCYSLFKRVESEASEKGIAVKLPAAVLATTYALLLAASRLPDPYWLLCWLSFVPLLALQCTVNELHRREDRVFERNARFGFGNLATVGIGGAVALLSILGTLGPNTGVVPGEDISPRTHRVLVEEGYLQPEERLLYFYSGALLSVRESGNLFTDQSVVSYEVLDGETYRASASYDEIASIDVDYGDLLTDTEITIHTTDGNEFLLQASSEEGGDQEFVTRLMSEWNRHRIAGL